MAIAISADQIGGFAWRSQSKSLNLSENILRRCRLILTSRGFDDRQKLALKRSMMPLGPQPQLLNDMVWGILDRKIDGARFYFSSNMDLE